MEAAGVPQPVVEALGSGSATTIEVQADLSKLSTTASQNTETKVANVLAVSPIHQAQNVAISDVGPTWGSQITKKAIIAVIVFFIIVVLYISFRFEWKMALAAFIAVIHDLLITVGIYSLFGFQVTPDTVIAVLTILGYSLYDTVVVFDRIRDSTKGLGASGRMTYADVVNLSMNQVLARSINTSLVAILPVLSVLVIGAELLGATTLQYFGLALGHRPHVRCVLVDLHRLADPRPAERARASATRIPQKLANRDTRDADCSPLRPRRRCWRGPRPALDTYGGEEAGRDHPAGGEKRSQCKGHEVASRAPARTAPAAGRPGRQQARATAQWTATSWRTRTTRGNGGSPGRRPGRTAAGGTQGARTGGASARSPPPAATPTKGQGKGGGKGGRRR